MNAQMRQGDERMQETLAAETREIRVRQRQIIVVFEHVLVCVYVCLYVRVYINV